MFAEQHGPLPPTLTHSHPPVNPDCSRGGSYNPGVRPGVAAFLVAAVLPLSGCGGGSGGTETEWAGPPRPDDRGRLDVGAFNDYLDARPEDASAPVVAVTRFLRLDRASAAN